MNSTGRFFAEEAKNFVDVTKKFFDPLRKRPFSLFVLPTTIVIVVLLYITTGIGELARKNSEEALFLAADALVLGAEPISEVGPDFTEESRNNGKALRVYVEHMLGKRHLADILRLLHREYRPKKRLLPLLAALEKPPEDEKEAREVIRKSGDQIIEFYKDSEELSSRKIIWFKPERLPEDLVSDLDEALEKSRELVNKLEQQPTVENALAACQANRRTIVLLFLARMGYGSQEKINQFLTVSEKTGDCKERLAGTIEDPEVKELVLAWCDSEQRRVHILKAMLHEDMEKVRKLLKEAIEKALMDRRRLESTEQVP